MKHTSEKREYSKTSFQFRFATSKDKIQELDKIAHQRGISVTKLINETLDSLLQSSK